MLDLLTVCGALDNNDRDFGYECWPCLRRQYENVRSWHVTDRRHDRWIERTMEGHALVIKRPKLLPSRVVFQQCLGNSRVLLLSYGGSAMSNKDVDVGTGQSAWELRRWELGIASSKLSGVHDGAEQAIMIGHLSQVYTCGLSNYLIRSLSNLIWSDLITC